jgi:hypothetical protein
MNKKRGGGWSARAGEREREKEKHLHYTATTMAFYIRQSLITFSSEEEEKRIPSS